METKNLSLCQLINKAKNKNNQAMESIINLFTPKIRRTIRLSSYRDKEDLEQELKIEVIKGVMQFDSSYTPGFYDFIESINTSH